MSSMLSLLRTRSAQALALFGFALISAPAHAWWNHDWTGRKALTIDADAAGLPSSTALNEVTVLVRLHEGVFKFSDAASDGADLRFVAEDDKTPLKFHVEKFDTVFNLGFVWVQVPKLASGQKQQIWMYYGNPKAANGSEPKDSYDSNQTLVWHFAERGTGPVDSTVNRNNASTAVPLDESGLLGNAGRFDGQLALALPASPSLAIAAGGGLTWTAWLQSKQPQNAVLYAQRDGGNAFIVGLAAGVPYVDVAGQRIAATQAITDGNWHALAVTIGSALTVYVDGKPAATGAVALPALAGRATLGGDAPVEGAAPQSGFIGEIDEFTLARTARPAEWIAAAAINQGSEDKLVQFGTDEEMAGASTGYFGVILKSVTLDGWVVIGVLMVMAVISFMVMANKAMQINRVAQGNRSFLDLFRKLSGDLTEMSRALSGNGPSRPTGAQAAALKQSPLLPLFQTALSEVSRRVDKDGQPTSAGLNPHAVESIRTLVDAGLTQEVAALNKQMVLLTIAISGGPFIGLLGTVVGVMITFGAIAASGDVNVNSIAPGIAAALAATVAGLFVAIPALFGYNYLLIRIKDLTAEMQAFLNALIARIAESNAQSHG